MLPCLTKHWGNPSSAYELANAPARMIETARGQVALLIGTESRNIIFTGCGTESNNMALKSLARSLGRQNTKIVVSEIEHSAVLRPTEAMAAAGYEVERIGTDGEGRLEIAAFEQAVESSRPGFASIMWANNETGVVQPMAEVCETARRAGWAVHTDAIQAVGKVPVRVDEVPVDFLSISGHKFHAPKGVGCLFIGKKSQFQPMIRGGGQEDGRRSGTENVPYIVGLGEAAAIMAEEAENGGLERVESLRNRLEEQLQTGLGDGPNPIKFNGSREHRTGNVAHVSFEGCVAAEMLPMLDERGVQCSAGSACMTGKNQPSHVQKAMGFSDERAFSSLRLSLSIFSTEAEVDEAAEKIVEVVKALN